MTGGWIARSRPDLKIGHHKSSGPKLLSACHSPEKKEWLQDRRSQGRTLGRDVDGAAAAAGDRGRRRTGATAGGSGQIRELFLKIGLKRRVSLLRGGKTSGLQGLAEHTEILLQGIGGLLPAAVVVVMVTLRLTRLLLDVLLDGGEIGLCGGKIACL